MWLSAANDLTVRHSRMAILAAEATHLEARDVSRTSGFRIELISDWKQARARWKDPRPPTPFQDFRWLDAWYGAVRNVEPLIAYITDAPSAEQVALLPLVRRTHRGLRVVEFADLDLTDYNAPLLGPAAPCDAARARLLWRELVAALKRVPGGADLVRLRKLPLELDGWPNPLALLAGTGGCAVNGNVVTIVNDFETWRSALKKSVRKQLDRSWRTFASYPQASFRVVRDEASVRTILAAMEIQQKARMRHLGQNFVPDEEAYTAFYRSLVADNIGSGYAVLSALTVGEEVVATLLGIRTGTRYVMVRISNAGEKWSNCSPGRLIIARTIAALHQDGVRVFDFSTGNYAYKRRFGVVPLRLVNLTKALSWRGVPLAARDGLVREIRRHPRFAVRISRALGMRSAREEYEV